MTPDFSMLRPWRPINTHQHYTGIWVNRRSRKAYESPSQKRHVLEYRSQMAILLSDQLGAL